MRMHANISTSEATQNRFRKKDTPHSGVVSILRLCRASVSNLRIACVAVSNLGICGLTNAL